MASDLITSRFRNIIDWIRIFLFFIKFFPVEMRYLRRKCDKIMYDGGDPKITQAWCKLNVYD